MKVTVITLSLLLVVGPIALAATDLGLSQDINGDTALRLDTDHFLFKVPLKDRIDQLGVGGKLQTPIGDLYGLGEAYLEGRNGFTFESLDLGLGYPIRWNNTILRGELTVTNPQWSEATDWQFHPIISLQFNFGNIFTKGGNNSNGQT